MEWSGVDELDDEKEMRTTPFVLSYIPFETLGCLRMTSRVGALRDSGAYSEDVQQPCN